MKHAQRCKSGNTRLVVLSGLLSTYLMTGAGEAAELSQVCRAAIAALMGRDVSIISEYKTEPGISYVKYSRSSDKSIWKYRCKTDGMRVIWAGIDVNGPESGPGRWRDDAHDETVTYSETSGGIEIFQKFSDGSTISDTVKF